jgi:hypothetical protein
VCKRALVSAALQLRCVCVTQRACSCSSASAPRRAKEEARQQQPKRQQQEQQQQQQEEQQQRHSPQKQPQQTSSLQRRSSASPPAQAAPSPSGAAPGAPLQHRAPPDGLSSLSRCCEAAAAGGAAAAALCGELSSLDPAAALSLAVAWAPQTRQLPPETVAAAAAPLLAPLLPALRRGAAGPFCRQALADAAWAVSHFDAAAGAAAAASAAAAAAGAGVGAGAAAAAGVAGAGDPPVGRRWAAELEEAMAVPFRVLPAALRGLRLEEFVAELGARLRRDVIYLDGGARAVEVGGRRFLHCAAPFCVASGTRAGPGGRAGALEPRNPPRAPAPQLAAGPRWGARRSPRRGATLHTRTAGGEAHGVAQRHRGDLCLQRQGDGAAARRPHAARRGRARPAAGAHG